jgi:hypothetical protein
MVIEEFSNKYYSYEINKKKLSALINFSESLDSFKDWLALEFITVWLDKEFLEREEEIFLDHLLVKYGINYLDWSYKSMWVKNQIASRRTHQQAFYFEDLEEARMQAWRTSYPSFIAEYKHVNMEAFRNKSTPSGNIENREGTQEFMKTS